MNFNNWLNNHTAFAEALNPSVAPFSGNGSSDAFFEEWLSCMKSRNIILPEGYTFEGVAQKVKQDLIKIGEDIASDDVAFTAFKKRCQGDTEEQQESPYPPYTTILLVSLMDASEEWNQYIIPVQQWLRDLYEAIEDKNSAVAFELSLNTVLAYYIAQGLNWLPEIDGFDYVKGSDAFLDSMISKGLQLWKCPEIIMAEYFMQVRRFVNELKTRIQSRGLEDSLDKELDSVSFYESALRKALPESSLEYTEEDNNFIDSYKRVAIIGAYLLGYMAFNTGELDMSDPFITLVCEYVKHELCD